MRPIDADALLENYNLKDATKYGNRDAEQQYHSYSTMMLYEVADMIEDAPTLEVAQVVHGHWIKTCEGVKLNVNTWKAVTKFAYGCNICGYITGNQGGGFDFCPKCGARMDGKEE